MCVLISQPINQLVSLPLYFPALGITGRNMPFAGEGKSLGGGRAPVDARTAALKVTGLKINCAPLTGPPFVFMFPTQPLAATAVSPAMCAMRDPQGSR